MIDTFSESVISVEQAAKHVSKITGKTRNKRVILRWISRGCSGVKLAAIRVGGELHTSKEAVNAFLNRAQEARSKQLGKATREGIRRARMVEQQAAQLGI